MGGPGDEWRCDKRGRLLKPHALYMRFYRNIRRISTHIIYICNYIYIYLIRYIYIYINYIICLFKYYIYI